MNKKFVSISLGAGLIVGSAAGLIAVPAISGAQTADTTATAPANRPDPSVRLNETLKPLVDAGTITQAQADAVIAALKADMPERGERGRGGKGGAGLEVAAQSLGMSADELQTALKGGQTLAQVGPQESEVVRESARRLLEDDVVIGLARIGGDGDPAVPGRHPVGVEAGERRVATALWVVRLVETVHPAESLRQVADLGFVP